MDLSIIKAIQSGATGFFDEFFLLVTQMGDVVFFVILFFLFYWCYDKRFSLFFAFYYLTCYGVNSFLKIIIRRPRPWQASSAVVNYTNSSGFSMPSGHSSSIAVIGTATLIELHSNKKSPKWLRITAYVIIPIIALLVAFSRMYLGQHYLTDVLLGLAIGVGVAFATKYLYRFIKREDIVALWVLPVAFAALFLYPGEMFTSNLAHSKVYAYIGLITSVILGYWIEKKYIKFDIKANALFNVFKICFGLLSTWAVYALMGVILPDILVLKFVQTFVTGMYFSCGIMWFFKFFAKSLQIEYKSKQEKKDGVYIKK